MQNHESVNNENKNNEQEVTFYGGFFARLAAWLIDSIITGTVLLVVKLPVAFVSLFNSDFPLTKNVLFQYSIWDVFIYLAGVSYFVLMTYYTGATLGKRAFNLRVISEDESKLTFINVLYRETIGRYLSGVVMYIGYFMIGADRQKRALHDILCDTRVIYSCKVRPVYVYGKMNPMGPMYGYGPMNQAGPMTQVGPMNQAGPMNQVGPMNQMRPIEPRYSSDTLNENEVNGFEDTKQD